MKNLPLVSILIPTYNQPEFFRVALESALNQTYPNIEIIVSDDSTDDRVKKVCDEYKEHRVQYIYHGHDATTHSNWTNSSKSMLNCENLLAHSHGEFVNLLMHDDIIYPEKISKMMEFFQSDIGDQIAVVTSSRDVIDVQGKKFYHTDLLDQLNMYPGQDYKILTGEEVGRYVFMIFGNFIGENSTVLMRRKDFYRPEVQRYTNSYCFGIKDTSFGDLSIFLEACKDGRELIYIREPLSAYRAVGGENQSSTNGSVLMHLAMDFIQFVVAAYVKDIYLHTWEDFCRSCDCALGLAQNTLKFLTQDPKVNFNVSIDLLDKLPIILESIVNKDYELTFKVVADWIRKYNSEHFDVSLLERKKFI